MDHIEHTLIFIARQHIDARYWYSKYVRLSVRPSVCLCNVPVSDENGLTYRHSFFTIFQRPSSISYWDMEGVPK